jgi:hypothetical protein
VIAELPVVRIGEAKRPSRARFGEGDAQARRTRHAGDGGQRQALEHGEHDRVQADAEREHGDHRQRERPVLDEHPDSEARVADQVAEGRDPRRRPDAAGRLPGEEHVPEILECGVARGLAVGAIGDPFVLGNPEVRPDLLLQILVVEVPPSQP